MSLISREEAIDALNKIDVSDGVGISSIACGVQESAINVIQHLPSAQPEQKKGEWILSDLQDENEVANDNFYYVCSCCGASDLHAKSMKVPFCWKCGAMMRGEEEESEASDADSD